MWFVFIPDSSRQRVLFAERWRALHHARQERASGYRARVGQGTGDVEPGERGR